MVVGTLIIYLFGAVQGKIVTQLPWSIVFVGWVLPFIIGDTIKLLAAAYIAKTIDIKKYVR
jgi:biotin transporter BioY